jgi:UDP-N-acetylmuramyl pentapeptide phosphotransferase/UDP-N-acetylglucosamine-1-phosphate transferase
VLVWYTFSPMQWLEMVLLGLAVAWITNLYNFMDGSDGLASGMAIAGFSTYAIAAAWSADATVLYASAALAGASAACLVFNFHPARVFLGDVGSIPLGFLAASIGLMGWRDDAWPLWFPFLVFAPFIGDATLTLLRRAANGEKVWQAHRDHYYQRLVRLGFGHRGTAYVAYALMLLCAGAALYARQQRPLVQWTTVGAVVAVLAAVAGWIELRWRRAQ